MVEVVRNVINAGRLDIVTDIYRTMEVSQHLEKWPMKEGLSGLILIASHYTLCLHAINLSLSPLLRVYANAEYTSPTNGCIVRILHLQMCRGDTPNHT